ncbi:MAG TPA: CDP-archaeol synthase, partial [Rhodanobacter sp.]|nr:CDP-archaeol synthase [Rhodanobacter sp.]
RMVVDAVPTQWIERTRHHHTAVRTLSAIPEDRFIVHAFAQQLVSLLYFMAPAYLANMAPPFVRYWKGWNRPINERLLGSHKTVIGFALGVAAGVLATGVQAALALPMSRLDYAAWPLLGLGFGLGAMAGDSLKSLLKRRLRITPGQPWVPFDQVDFVLGALVLVAPWARLSWFEVLLILVGSFLAGLLVNRLAFRLGIKGSPW